MPPPPPTLFLFLFLDWRWGSKGPATHTQCAEPHGTTSLHRPGDWPWPCPLLALVLEVSFGVNEISSGPYRYRPATRLGVRDLPLAQVMNFVKDPVLKDALFPLGESKLKQLVIRAESLFDLDKPNRTLPLLNSVSLKVAEVDVQEMLDDKGLRGQLWQVRPAAARAGEGGR